MSFQIKKFNSIVASMINWMSGATTKITDFNQGSVVRTILEAVAMELEELYYQLLQATQEAIEEAIYRTFNFPRNPSEKATGMVRFTRMTGSETAVSIPAGTLIGTDTAPSVVFETQSDALIPEISGFATGGDVLSLIDATVDFTALGIIRGSKIINDTDGDETQISGVTDIPTVHRLNFAEMNGGSSFAWPGYIADWVTGHSYHVNDIVTYPALSSNGYICTVDHISGVFLTDLETNNYWEAYTGKAYRVIVPYVDVPVRALIAGIGGNIAAHALIVLRSNVPNIATVDNSSSFSSGAEDESDLSRKARFALYIQSLARATRGALEYAARTVDQVVSAKAVDDVRPTVFVFDTVNYTDITQAMRNPGDGAVKLLPDTQPSGSCLFIGANEPFNWINMHLFAEGICITPGDVVWEYYSGISLGWIALPDLDDGTIKTPGSGTLTQSGALSFTLPTDWLASSVNGQLKMWVRMRLTNLHSYSSIPTGDYCSLPPGLGYVNLYCMDGSGSLSAELKASVVSAVELYRGCGIIVDVIAPQIIYPYITVEITVAANYDKTELEIKVTQAIIDYLNAKVLAEDLYIADLYRLIMEVNNKAIVNAHVTLPTEDMVVSSASVLRSNTSYISVTAYQA